MGSKDKNRIETVSQSLGEALRVLSSLRRLAIQWQKLRNPSQGRQIERLTLVDIGASYFLHKPWIPLILGGRAKLLSIDPNSQNLSYLDHFPNLDVKKVPAALYSEQGVRTLYVTNVDSGSSLFPPQPSEEDLVRHPGLYDYFFPLKEVALEVTTLDLLAISSSNFLAVKIDTQGAELEILKGASELLRKGRILSVEAEVSLLSRPIMSGSPKYADIAIFLESFNFELMWIRPTTPVKRGFRDQIRQVEADALFLLRKESVIASGGSCVEAYRAILQAYGLSQEIEVLDAMLASRAV